MALKELFFSRRPTAYLNPRDARRIDPRFPFTRLTSGMAVNPDGDWASVPAGLMRLHHDPVTRNVIGYLLEGRERTNLIYNNSFVGAVAGTPGTLPANMSTALNQGINREIVGVGKENGIDYMDIRFFGTNTGGTFSVSVGFTGSSPALAGETYSVGAYLKRINGDSRGLQLALYGAAGGNISLSTSTVVPGTNALIQQWFEHKATLAGAGIGDATFRILCTITAGAVIDYTFRIGWPQMEKAPKIGTPIVTSGSQVTQAPEQINIDSITIPPVGSIILDAQLRENTAGSVLVSMANASNQKINFGCESRAETYNSTALLTSYNSQVKVTLPLPVPTLNRETHIFSWGTTNYQHTENFSRRSAALAASVPSGLNRIVIGRDATDPAKAMMGYINALYLLNEELPGSLAEALVESPLVTIDADTYNPTGPAGALSLIINTQGIAGAGDLVFALPAESVLNNNDILIRWGDGTESGLELAAAEVGAAGLSHTYPAAGIYPLWVTGKMQNLFFNNSASAPDLLRVEAWGTGEMFTQPSTMANAFFGCRSLTLLASSGLPNTEAVANWVAAFKDCAALTSFPLFNTQAATNLSEAWSGCESLTSFPLIDTALCTNFSLTWQRCAGLTSFPLINTAAGTDFLQAWDGCGELTSFPLINTSAAINLAYAWRNCSSLTSFPLINTANCTSMNASWNGCNALTSFPLLNCANVTILQGAWLGCSGLTSFPLLVTSAVTDFSQAWFGCAGLISFPAINTSNGTSFGGTWHFCSGLTSFPTIDVSKGTRFDSCWAYCSGLTEFPSLTFSSAVNYTSVAGGVNGFYESWTNCTNLATFPPNMFNNVLTNHFEGAFNNCALTDASIENILVSINSIGNSNGRLGLSGGTNASKTTWTTAANTAYDALIARGWTITFRP